MKNKNYYIVLAFAGLVCVAFVYSFVQSIEQKPAAGLSFGGLYEHRETLSETIIPIPQNSVFKSTNSVAKKQSHTYFYEQSMAQAPGFRDYAFSEAVMGGMSGSNFNGVRGGKEKPASMTQPAINGLSLLSQKETHRPNSPATASNSERALSNVGAASAPQLSSIGVAPTSTIPPPSFGPDPGTDPTNFIPVGEGWWILLLMGIGYLGTRRWSK